MVPMAVYIAQIISTHWMPFLMPKMTSLTSENIINQKRKWKQPRKSNMAGMQPFTHVIEITVGCFWQQAAYVQIGSAERLNGNARWVAVTRGSRTAVMMMSCRMNLAKYTIQV